ncbi:MAG TPA: hypothetical protein VH853_01900 [Polyangia bacterium]|jgi:hypothetical protein|nr:hypothetical protein [Polyangia bacterium]
MKTLVPCSGCSRHVNSDEMVCPFCQVTLVPQHHAGVCTGPCSGHAFPRLGRAALMAAGAALLCTACLPSGSAAYGVSVAPHVDAGGPRVDAGAPTDGGPDSGDAAK